MLGLSLHIWENIMLLSLGAAALAAAFVIVSTYAVVQLQRQSNIEAAKQIAEANAQSDHARSEASRSAVLAADAQGRAARATRGAAQANERASQLEKDAETARKETAEANARAVEATAKALAAQVALEKIRTPRAIDIERQARISEAIKPFAGTPYDIALQPDPEPIALLVQILSALDAGGWKAESWRSAGGIGIVFNAPNGMEAGILYVEGIHVEFSETRPEWEAPVHALINVLAAAGLEVKGTRAKNVRDNAVHIVIGKKPM